MKVHPLAAAAVVVAAVASAATSPPQHSTVSAEQDAPNPTLKPGEMVVYEVDLHLEREPLDTDEDEDSSILDRTVNAFMPTSNNDTSTSKSLTINPFVETQRDPPTFPDHAPVAETGESSSSPSEQEDENDVETEENGADETSTAQHQEREPSVDARIVVYEQAFEQSWTTVASQRPWNVSEMPDPCDQEADTDCSLSFTVEMTNRRERPAQIGWSGKYEVVYYPSRRYSSVDLDIELLEVRSAP